MAPPAWPHRHLLLDQLLEIQSTHDIPNAFLRNERDDQHDMGGYDAGDGRTKQLDILLLRLWSMPLSGLKEADRDVLQHAENLRLKSSDFENMGRVGDGQFGSVDAVRCRLDGNVYAMKTIEKSMAVRAGQQLSLSSERLIHLLAQSGQPESTPVPALIAAFQTPTSLHLVTTYAPCGSLWDRISGLKEENDVAAYSNEGVATSMGFMTEAEVKWWGLQMVSAISWLHGKGYAHRDIKPHNFLLFPDCRLKLTDFGSSAPIGNYAVSPTPDEARPLLIAQRHCSLPAGTPDYVAPEVLTFAEEAMIAAAEAMEDDIDRTIRPADRIKSPPSTEAMGYDASIDWWSFGVTLYEMFFGVAPFFAPTIGETYQRILKCQEYLRVPVPTAASATFLGLIMKLLVPHNERLGFLGDWQVQSHAFFARTPWADIQSMKAPSGFLPPQPVEFMPSVGNQDELPILNSPLEEVTFDHFFNSSAGSSLLTATSSSIGSSQSHRVTERESRPWHRWVGWTWHPPSAFFDDKPISSSAPPLVSPQQRHPYPTRSFTTPSRSSYEELANPPQSLPNTVPRTINRTRPISEQQAFRELLKCVQSSARKRMASGSKSALATSLNLSRDSPDAEERQGFPPTPTPAAFRRDQSAFSMADLRSRARSHGPYKGDSLSVTTDQGEPQEESSQRDHSVHVGTTHTVEEMEGWHEELARGLGSLEERLVAMMTTMTA